MSTSATPTVYAIPNCDTVKKARQWLDEHGVAYQFHDYKKQGVPPERVRQWMQTLGWEVLLNRKGPTWRKLDPAEQAAVVDADSALACMQAHSSVIKRPVIEWPHGALTVGFDPEALEAAHRAGLKSRS
ncbi:MAG: ArsC family reductase [Rhodoferax sp.]